MTDHAAQSLSLAVGVSALLTVVCRKLRFPALLPLMAVGLALGTSGAGVINGASLGEALKGFITVSIGLLIFEGALHLNREELSHAPRAVWGLLTIGAVITWAGSAFAAHWLLGLSPLLAAILGATLIVTGPTVVQPVLRLVRVSPRLHSVLGAEAVLIDPIGVVATIATLEVVRLYAQASPDVDLARQGAWAFLKPLIGGAGVGVVMGLASLFVLRILDRRNRPEPHLLNLLGIGLCMSCVGIGEAIAPEAGLAAVTICGVFVARAHVLGATELRSFKELLATILVGTLFILLSSRFDAASFHALTRQDVLFVVVLLFVVRPACVLVSAWRSKLSWPERVFASLFAPRGIVALSVIAIVATELAPSSDQPDQNGAMQAFGAEVARLEPIMFLVIIVTVLSATTLSPLLAWVLRVKAGRGNALVLVGAHPLSVSLAQALAAHGIHVRLIDRNPSRVVHAHRQGLDIVDGDATDTRWLDDAGAPHDGGWVIAWTGNDDVDQVAARWGEQRYGAGHARLWSDKPARDSLRALDLGAGVPLSEAIERFTAGDLSITDAPTPGELERVFACIDNGILSFVPPDPAAIKAGNSHRFIGIRRRSYGPAPSST